MTIWVCLILRSECAIVSKTNANIVTDLRYWIQARTQVDSNRNLVEGGLMGGLTDWVAFLVARAKDTRIGIDARMLAREKEVGATAG